MYRLSIHDVQRRLHEKSEKKLQCYDKVLEICHKRILSSTDREKTHCYFEFPEYIIGFPLFDLNACMEHCKKHLVANGFLVRYHFPNKFYISWDVQEIREHKAEQRRNTPLTALLPEAKSKSVQPKLTTGHSGQQPTLSLQSSPSSQSLQSTQPHVTVPHIEKTQNTSNTSQQLPLVASPPTRPSVFDNMSFDMYQKITQPLPITPLKYDPNDIPSAIDVKSNIIDNTFFPNNLKQLLTSDIGVNNKKVTQKQSGKISINI